VRENDGVSPADQNVRFGPKADIEVS